jgi:hypothetical protein
LLKANIFLIDYKAANDGRQQEQAFLGHVNFTCGQPQIFQAPHACVVAPAFGLPQ